MFRLTKLSASKVIGYFPKMTSANYLIPVPLPWPLPWPWPWPQPPPPTPLPSPMLPLTLPVESSSSPPTKPSLSPPTLSASKLTVTPRPETHDEWFNRRLNDKTKDMFLL